MKKVTIPYLNSIQGHGELKNNNLPNLKNRIESTKYKISSEIKRVYIYVNMYIVYNI